MMCAATKISSVQRFIEFSRGETLTVRRAVASIGGVDNTTVRLTAALANEYRAAGRVIRERCAAVRALIAALANAHVGYAALDLESLGGSDLEHKRRCLHAIVAAFALPMGVFIRYGLWKPIGVDLRSGKGRLGSVEMIPLHVDFVNASNPPEFVFLHCLRSDPAGGGASLVSNLPDAVARLSPEDSAILRDVALKEGAFYELANIGYEQNPFRMLEAGDKVSQPTRLPWIRFTAKVLANLPDGPLRGAISRLNQVLWAQRVRYALREGQVIIIRQRLACHGREELGFPRVVDQGSRLLEQGFATVWAGADRSDRHA